jgi:hypothetical protein
MQDKPWGHPQGPRQPGCSGTCLYGSLQGNPDYLCEASVRIWEFCSHPLDLRIVRAEGGAMRIEELAHQRWQGEKIAEERFYYDPSQMK